MATYPFSSLFLRESACVVLVKTGIYIPYMEMTTSLKARLRHCHLREAITVVASFVIIKEVIKSVNVLAVSLTV